MDLLVGHRLPVGHGQALRRHGVEHASNYLLYVGADGSSSVLQLRVRIFRHAVHVTHETCIALNAKLCEGETYFKRLLSLHAHEPAGRK
jgi:hypothetical protein